MALAKRIIPTILCRGRTLVKGVAFDAWRSVGLAAQAVRIHSMRGVDELVLLDISATAEGRGPDLRLVEELSATCFMPLAVGGGIRTLQDAQDLFNAGADKIVLGRGAVPPDGLLQQAKDRFGCQAIVVSLDIRDGTHWINNGKDDMDVPATIAARTMEYHGAGEILLNSIDREGTLQGYDLDLIRQVSGSVGIPVIAACGAGTYEHLAQAIDAGADAVAAGAMFLFTDQTPKGAAEYLSSRQIEVRL